MKINWGTGIAIFYSIFAIAMLSAVIVASTKDVHLVTPKYYAAELDHNARMQAVVNSRNLATPLAVKYDPAVQQITLTFPQTQEAAITGKVWLYCITDSHQDLHIDIAPNGEYVQHISTETLKKGRWKLMVDWERNGMRFFDEHPVVISH